MRMDNNKDGVGRGQEKGKSLAAPANGGFHEIGDDRYCLTWNIS